MLTDSFRCCSSNNCKLSLPLAQLAQLADSLRTRLGAQSTKGLLVSHGSFELPGGGGGFQTCSWGMLARNRAKMGTRTINKIQGFMGKLTLWHEALEKSSMDIGHATGSQGTCCTCAHL